MSFRRARRTAPVGFAVVAVASLAVFQLSRGTADDADARGVVIVRPTAEPIAPMAMRPPIPTTSAPPEQRIAAEPVDPTWAPPAVATVERSLKRIPFLTTAGPLKVRCATTICEAIGTLPPLLDSEGRRQFLALLSDPIVTGPLATDGLRLLADRPATIGDDETFVLYIERGQAKALTREDQGLTGVTERAVPRSGS